VRGDKLNSCSRWISPYLPGPLSDRTSRRIRRPLGSEESLDLTRQKSLTSLLSDLTPLELGAAVLEIRRLFASQEFHEVILSPFDAYPVDYVGASVDVPDVGQLRFNTEPEIWEAQERAERFFSVTHLFRREAELNSLRHSSFIIVDFYQPGAPDHLLKVFRSVLSCLAESGYTRRLSSLPFETSTYDPTQDAPKLKSAAEAKLVLTSGYDAAHSFFEVDRNGNSTRREIFLVTPRGYLEIGVVGIAGWNKNPHYKMRPTGRPVPDPPRDLSGMGFGLERLLVAEQILALT
jgi:hypothetical protein